MFHHHRSTFPLIIAALTIALVVFMVYAFSNRQQVNNSEDLNPQLVSTTPQITAADYRRSIKEVVAPFSVAITAQENDLGRLGVIERTLSGVLEQRVPTEFRDFHLELAFSLSRMGEDLRGDTEGDSTENFVQDLARYQALITSTPWLQ